MLNLKYCLLFFCVNKIDANKRLKQEIHDLKHKIDHQHNDNEESATLLRRKHQESISEITAHMESLNRTKLK